MNLFVSLQYDLHDTFKELLPIEFSWTRQLRQYKHVLSCISQYRSRFPHRCLLVSCYALPLASEFLTSYERFFHDVLYVLILRFNEENTTQFSGIIELGFLDSPLWLRFALRCIRHMLPHIWPYIVGS